jgi:hypothetical protein
VSVAVTPDQGGDVDGSRRPVAPLGPDLAAARRAAAWDAASAIGTGAARREVFHFDSGGEQVYGSLSGQPQAGGPCLVLCPGWGLESARLLGWLVQLAGDLAALGGCGLVVHWPGFQDGPVPSSPVTFDRLVQVVRDAARAGQEHTGVERWSAGGVRLGAAIAAAAAPQLGAEHLLLVQPALDPAQHLADLERSGRRANLRKRIPPGYAFGYPIPPGLADPDAAALVTGSLASFTGRALAVRYRSPEPEPVPASVRTVTVPGAWAPPHRYDHAVLRVATVRALRRQLRRSA